GLAAAYQQDGRWNASAVKQVRGQANHSLDKVFLQNSLSYVSLRAASKEDPMWHHDCHSSVNVQRRDHVLHEREIALGLGGHTEAEATVAVALGRLTAPVVQRERRIG